MKGTTKLRGIGYDIPVAVKDYLVRVNDPAMDDRLKTIASPVLSSFSFQDAVERPIVKDGSDVAFAR